MEIKRKSPLQLQALQKFYAGENYPSHKEMEDLAAVLDLTYKQVRTWFIEKRRRDKSCGKMIVPPSVTQKLSAAKRGSRLGVASASRKVLKQRDPSCRSGGKSHATSSSSSDLDTSDVEGLINTRKKKIPLVQDLFTPDYVLSKIFRKDGPALGVEFDSLPSREFQKLRDARISHPTCPVNTVASKRRKVSEDAIINTRDSNESAPAKTHGIGKDLMTMKRHGIGKGMMTAYNNGLVNSLDSGECAPVKKHGIGKGLMTVWRAMNPNGGDIPTGMHFSDTEVTDMRQISSPLPHKPARQKKKRRQSMSVTRMLGKKLQEKKASSKRREVESKKAEIQKPSYREKCELLLGGVISQERLNQFAMLMDDEELELRESQAGPNPLTCSDHCASKGTRGCSLCKDLLPKFPPNSVSMKLPFAMQPWDSSPEVVRKLFKAFHFLYTYSVMVDICPFTLDELAQAFRDKDSLLLGKIHVALLKLLLSDVETEIRTGVLPNLSVSCKFLALLHSVEEQEFILEFWKNSLNPLTWTEILRQVLVAAGFGSKQGPFQREVLSKEMSLMKKYGLRPGTLKGELFRLLSEKGNNGIKVPDLARVPQIIELNLASSNEELELLICSTLSSDITLFEKISSSAYRLRISTLALEADDFQSDTEDSGSVHDDSGDCSTCSSSDSECDLHFSPRKAKHVNYHKSKNNALVVDNEIDESHPGEVWLLGLMEGEYSDLNIEEKLNALVALIDILSAGSSIRMEDSTRASVDSAPSLLHYGSGGKIKRASAKQQSLPRPSWVHLGQMNDAKETYTSSKHFPVDSSVLLLKSGGKEKFCDKEKDAKETDIGIHLHPMQSIFLGSDRRYNRYWLFLGPCTLGDPGHKRVYFESSEDGHWEVIGTEQALHSLLSVLDERGTREAFLIDSLEKREAFLCQEMSCAIANGSEIIHPRQYDKSELATIREESSSPVSDVDNNLSMTDISKEPLPACGAIVLAAGKKGKVENQQWDRVQEFDSWTWNYFYCSLNAVKHSKRSYLESLTRCGTCHDLYWRDEKHCKHCHTTFELDFDLEERYAIHSATCREKMENEMFPKHKILSSQLQSLKAAVHAIESAMPEDSLVGAWTKSAHRLWVKRLRRTSSLTELLQVVADFVAAINEDWLCQCNLARGSSFMDEIVAVFPSMPQTSSALALWLVKLDDLISPYLRTSHC
ncbi:hypothetical protein Tsubulata_040811 [Turnera subulata]|uniref:Homeobox domain-containing protein n=1 Tax=Turnera subulata TaxID=218843 RepID=A0A9Q0GJS3_9ROSI|nr:hypothetical protein Tsubulata_040811 [Turnera subulata]